MKGNAAQHQKFWKWSTLRCACLLAAMLLVAYSPAGYGGGISGYFGDRSGVYPDAKPPVRWGEGTNILWKVMLPNLGNGAPAVAGNRVLVLSEPGWKHDLPVISCYAMADGKLLWEKEIDHLHLTVTNDIDRQEIRDHWHKHLAWIRDYYLLFHDYSAEKESTDVKQRMEAMGVKTWGSNYLYGKFDKEKVSDYGIKTFGKKFPEVGKALIGLDTWRCMGSHDMMWIGEVFGTPVTDGEALYVATAWGVYACYDLDGNVRWMHAMSPERPHDYCSVARSPILWGDLVISDLGRMVRAFDRASGELKWEQKRAGGVHEFVSPVILRMGSQEVLWTAGPAAFTLPDGKPLKIEGWPNNGMMVAVNTDRPDTLFMTGGGEHGGWEGKGNGSNPPPAAVRFMLEDDVLKAKVLWNTINGNPAIGTVGLLYHDGKLYFSGAKGVILDADTGLVHKGLFGGAVPGANHHMAIAGGHAYGLSPDGTMAVHSLDGRLVARNTLSVTPFDQLDKENQAKRLSQWFAWPKAENRNWCFSYASPFAVSGDRIYIRSLDHLYCIKDKGEAPVDGGTPDVTVEQLPDLLAQAEKGKNVWGQLASLGAAATSAVPRLEALLPGARDPLGPFNALAAIDSDAAMRNRVHLVDFLVKSNLSDHMTPWVGARLYDLGPVPRDLLQPIEARIDERMYPFNGPKHAENFVSACYRRSGEVGFSRIWLHPLPWKGGPKRGEEIRLEWATLNATKVTIEPDIGDVPLAGEHKLVLNEPTTFTFTAEGKGGPSVRTIRVKFPEPKAK